MLKTFIIHSDHRSRTALRQMLVANPSVIVVGECARLTDALQETKARRPDLIIVEIEGGGAGHDEGTPLRAVESLARVLPDAAIFATGPSASADFEIQVIRAGAIEFLRRPVKREDLTGALDKVLRLRRGTAPSREAGRITSVFSTKGGLGVTTVAANLAVCLAAQAPERTLLIDLDTRQSDIATVLNLRSAYSVFDALDNLNRLDESLLHGFLTKHESGLLVLPGPSRMDRIELTADQIEAGLEIIRSHFSHVVLDLPHDLCPGTLAGLEETDTILFLTSLNVSALRSSASGLAALNRSGVDPQKIRIVVMREGSEEAVSIEHAQEALGLSVFWKIPNDYSTVVSSINNGQPVVTAAPRSKISRNLRQLAEAVSGTPSAVEHQLLPRSAASLLRLMWNPKGASGG